MQYCIFQWRLFMCIKRQLFVMRFRVRDLFYKALRKIILNSQSCRSEQPSGLCFHFPSSSSADTEKGNFSLSKPWRHMGWGRAKRFNFTYSSPKSALDGSPWSMSRLSHFNPGKKAGTHWIEGWNGSQNYSGRFRRETFFFCHDSKTGLSSP